ncbi:hypothetical protein FA15DRAFT_682633 [Coprinopsis marcescibilis]|uniref:Uncharacterized protein n=1 Tax=Coprinopsis marcescibilis TaxID=230819 RepID=A0A5C3KIZ9_COPMA|nr:hypothetical protein FA15DRAFT_682633 [Coprinopsis marcescibilis]
MHDEHKCPTGHVFVRQPYSLQIIQLVEEPAPPPRKLSAGSSIASDSASSYWSSDCSESAMEDEDEEEEQSCSSYCSSDLAPEQPPTERVQSSTDTYSLRLKRILAWREDFYAHADALLSESSLPSLKRKFQVDEDDNVSHSSKRSRSQASSQGESSVSSLGMHSCPACDAFFDTQQSLRQHGLDAKANNEACSAAVEYEFE